MKDLHLPLHSRSVFHARVEGPPVRQIGCVGRPSEHWRSNKSLPHCYKGQKACNIFNISFPLPPKTPHLGPPEKKWMCLNLLGKNDLVDVSAPKTMFSPPSQNSPIRRRHRPGHSAPPGKQPPPLLGFSIKNGSPPPPGASDPPLPLPERKKKYKISETSTKTRNRDPT